MKVKFYFLFLILAFTSVKALSDDVDSEQQWGEDRPLREFKMPQVSPDKTGVVVVRKEVFYGGGRRIWLTSNKHTMVSLPNASDTYFEIEPGVNTFNVVQEKMGGGFISRVTKPGEIIFLLVDFLDPNILRFVDHETISQEIKRSYFVKPLDEPRANDAYDDYVLSPGIFKLPIMENLDPSNKSIVENKNYATVKFYRTETTSTDSDEDAVEIAEMIKKWPLDIWDKKGYVGSTLGGQFFVTNIKPGNHTFIAKAGNYSVLSGNFEAGKEYAVEVVVSLGFVGMKVKLKPVNISKKSKRKKIKTWEQSLQAMILDRDYLNNYEISHRIEEGYTYLKGIIKKIDKKKIKAKKFPSKYGYLYTNN